MHNRNCIRSDGDWICAGGCTHDAEERANEAALFDSILRDQLAKAERQRDHWQEETKKISATLNEQATDLAFTEARIASYEMRIEDLEKALRDTYAIVKRAFVSPDRDENGRVNTDVNPTAMARIKGVLREHIESVLGAK